MRFLVHMKMPSANGMLTHHLTLEHPSNSVEELCSALNRQEFLVFQMFYKRTNMSGEVWWQDRGKVIINSSCIGKVQEFIEIDRDEGYDDANKSQNRNNRYSR